MNLICAHCDRYDAAPLSNVPPGWVEIVPDPASPPPQTRTEYKTPAGTIATHLGICPACDAYRKTAFQASLQGPADDDDLPRLF